MIEINNYQFKLINRDSSSYLELILIPDGEKDKDYHYSVYVKEFFESLGISKEEFCKKFNIWDKDAIFPEFKPSQKDEVLNYLQSLLSKEPNYEVY